MPWFLSPPLFPCVAGLGWGCFWGVLGRERVLKEWDPGFGRCFWALVGWEDDCDDWDGKRLGLAVMEGMEAWVLLVDREDASRPPTQTIAVNLAYRRQARSRRRECAPPSTLCRRIRESDADLSHRLGCALATSSQQLHGNQPDQTSASKDSDNYAPSTIGFPYRHDGFSQLQTRRQPPDLVGLLRVASLFCFGRSRG